MGQRTTKRTWTALLAVCCGMGCAAQVEDAAPRESEAYDPEDGELAEHTASLSRTGTGIVWDPNYMDNLMCAMTPTDSVAALRVEADKATFNIKPRPNSSLATDPRFEKLRVRATSADGVRSYDLDYAHVQMGSYLTYTLTKDRGGSLDVDALLTATSIRFAASVSCVNMPQIPADTPEAECPTPNPGPIFIVDPDDGSEEECRKPPIVRYLAL